MYKKIYYVFILIFIPNPGYIPKVYSRFLTRLDFISIWETLPATHLICDTARRYDKEIHKLLAASKKIIIFISFFNFEFL